MQDAVKSPASPPETGTHSCDFRTKYINNINAEITLKIPDNKSEFKRIYFII